MKLEYPRESLHLIPAVDMSNSRENEQGTPGEVLSVSLKVIETGKPTAKPDHEPLVTRRELLSYYCGSLPALQILVLIAINSVL